VHHGEAIQQDVALELSDLDADQLIDQLADLLWQYRGLKENGDARTENNE
jgi:hypothetical protein